MVGGADGWGVVGGADGWGVVGGADGWGVVGGADGWGVVGGADGWGVVGGAAGGGAAGGLGIGVPLETIWQGPASALVGPRLPSAHPARITATTLSSVMIERVDASNRTVRR